jgi:uncharacterized iron-regulated protein
MKRRLNRVTPGLMLAVCLLCLGSFGEHLRAYRVSDGKTITFEKMIGEVSRADIIFTGEVHDNGRHHHLQLEIIKGLSAAGVSLAIGLEMLPKESQGTLDRWVEGKVSLDDFKRFYETYWSQSWQLYRDIFLYARDHRIPLIGLNIPDEISRKVRESGFSSLSDREIKLLPPGLSCNVDEKYMEHILRAFAQHENDHKTFINFCEAQLLWDKSMAWYLLDYRKTHPARQVVVLTGITHAWKWGIPDQLRQFSGESNYRVLLPEIPSVVAPGTLTIDDADYLLLK